MLVHYSYPKGYIIADGVRVYGYMEPNPPSVISWATYRNNKETFIQASYTKQILESMFPGSEFPDIRFTYYEMKFLNWQQLCGVCKGIGITTNKTNRLRRRALQKFFKFNC